MKPFEEEDRYVYDLSPDDVVIDCGGYQGTFADEINRRYGCRVFVLEPVTEFFERCQDRFNANSKVKVLKFGISGENRLVQFSIRGDSTGEFAVNGELEEVALLSPAALLDILRIDDVALLKLNIEGAEFDVMESILRDELISRIRNAQIQWHNVAPHAAARRQAIISELSKTHELTFDADWVWQSWKRK